MHKTCRCPWPWTKVYLLEHGLVTSCSGLAFWPAWGALPWWPLQHGMHLVHRLDSSTVRHARWVPTCQSLTAAAVGMVSADFRDGGKYCLGGGGSIAINDKRLCWSLVTQKNGYNECLIAACPDAFSGKGAKIWWCVGWRFCHELKELWSVSLCLALFMPTASHCKKSLPL